MLYRIEAGLFPHLDDTIGRKTAASIREALGIPVKSVRTIKVFTLEGLDAQQVNTLMAKSVLHDPVLQAVSLSPLPLPEEGTSWIIEVGYRPGVTDNEGRTARDTAALVLGIEDRSSLAVYTSIQYRLHGPLTEEQVKFHFALIDTHTSAIVADEKSASKRFARAIDFYLVQDFSSAVADLTQTILLDGDFFPAYFMRALIRCKQLEYQKAEQAAETNIPGDKRKEITAVDYEVVRKDLDKVINLAPDFVYAYYNRANVSAMLKDYRAAIADYDKAIELNPDFADAYFNRGLTHIFLGNNKLGISDLSKAGELGIVSAYNVIKRFTDQTE